jgi:class 3 adenylate cyclase
MLLKRLGGKIRAQREKRGLKQQDIANALGISPQAVSKWERGENAPDIGVLKPLARLLGVSADYLLSVNDEKTDVFEASVLVSSVHGAFERSLGMQPRDFALWANSVFFQVTEITLRHEGVPIKFMGDAYLCFFSGPNAQQRAVNTALQAKQILSDDLRIGLSHGTIYLGSIGHPDYARPDIMGEVVNLAFLTQQWAESGTKSGIGATATVTRELGKSVSTGKYERVTFRGIQAPVEVCEVRLPGEKPRQKAKR